MHMSIKGCNFCIHISYYAQGHPRSAIILNTTIAIKDKNAPLNITVPIISEKMDIYTEWNYRPNRCRQ